MKKFKVSDLNKSILLDKNRNHYRFSCSMIGRCKPLFDNCEDNYGVERELRKHKVILINTETDTEMCCMYVYFRNKISATNFIKKLNKYLKNKEKLIKFIIKKYPEIVGIKL